MVVQLAAVVGLLVPVAPEPGGPGESRSVEAGDVGIATLFLVRILGRGARAIDVRLGEVDSAAGSAGEISTEQLLRVSVVRESEILESRMVGTCDDTYLSRDRRDGLACDGQRLFHPYRDRVAVD